MASAVAACDLLFSPTASGWLRLLSFFFFENWIYTATYMADARAMELPLVTLGDPEFAKHDWNTIFTNLGVLQYDTLIAGIVRFLGWCGMLACTAWLASRLRKPDPKLNREMVNEKSL